MNGYGRDNKKYPMSWKRKLYSTRQSRVELLNATSSLYQQMKYFDHWADSKHSHYSFYTTPFKRMIDIENMSIGLLTF